MLVTLKWRTIPTALPRTEFESRWALRCILSTRADHDLAFSSISAHARRMMRLADACTLAEVRSCFAALAGAATVIDQTVNYERLLLSLDRLLGDDAPAWADA